MPLTEHPNREEETGMDREIIAGRLLDAIERLDILSNGLEETIGSWAAGRTDTDVLRAAIVTEVLSDFDFGLEVGVNVECCCDRFFDQKLEEGFGDDYAIHDYLEKDSSELLDPMIKEFSDGFAIIPVMESLGMHEEAVDFALEVADSIDYHVEQKKFFYAYIDECLRAISAMIRGGVADGDPAGWMQEPSGTDP